jgi:flagellar protein FlaG
MIIGQVNSIDAIAIQTNSRRTEHEDSDEMVKSDSNYIQLNLNVTEDNVTRAVEQLNKDFDAGNRKFEYSHDKDTGRFIIKMKNSETDEVISQLPAQKILDYASGLMEYLGLNVDRKV